MEVKMFGREKLRETLADWEKQKRERKRRAAMVDACQAEFDLARFKARWEADMQRLNYEAGLAAQIQDPYGLPLQSALMRS